MSREINPWQEFYGENTDVKTKVERHSVERSLNKIRYKPNSVILPYNALKKTITIKERKYKLFASNRMHAIKPNNDISRKKKTKKGVCDEDTSDETSFLDSEDTETYLSSCSDVKPSPADTVKSAPLFVDYCHESSNDNIDSNVPIKPQYETNSKVLDNRDCYSSPPSRNPSLSQIQTVESMTEKTYSSDTLNAKCGNDSIINSNHNVQHISGNIGNVFSSASDFDLIKNSNPNSYDGNYIVNTNASDCNFRFHVDSLPWETDDQLVSELTRSCPEDKPGESEVNMAVASIMNGIREFKDDTKSDDASNSKRCKNDSTSDDDFLSFLNYPQKSIPTSMSSAESNMLIDQITADKFPFLSPCHSPNDNVDDINSASNNSTINTPVHEAVAVTCDVTPQSAVMDLPPIVVQEKVCEDQIILAPKLHSDPITTEKTMPVVIHKDPVDADAEKMVAIIHDKMSQKEAALKKDMDKSAKVKKSISCDSVPLHLRPFDPRLHCGVVRDGVMCRRSLLCKLHSVGLKRQVARPGDVSKLMRELREVNKLKRMALANNNATSNATTTSPCIQASPTVVSGGGKTQGILLSTVEATGHCTTGTPLLPASHAAMTPTPLKAYTAGLYAQQPNAAPAQATATAARQPPVTLFATGPSPVHCCSSNPTNGRIVPGPTLVTATTMNGLPISNLPLVLSNPPQTIMEANGNGTEGPTTLLLNASCATGRATHHTRPNVTPTTCLLPITPTGKQPLQQHAQHHPQGILLTTTTNASRVTSKGPAPAVVRPLCTPDPTSKTILPSNHVTVSQATVNTTQVPILLQCSGKPAETPPPPSLASPPSQGTITVSQPNSSATVLGQLSSPARAISTCSTSSLSSPPSLPLGAALHEASSVSSASSASSSSSSSAASFGRCGTAESSEHSTVAAVSGTTSTATTPLTGAAVAGNGIDCLFNAGVGSVASAATSHSDQCGQGSVICVHMSDVEDCVGGSESGYSGQTGVEGANGNGNGGAMRLAPSACSESPLSIVSLSCASSPFLATPTAATSSSSTPNPNSASAAAVGGSSTPMLTSPAAASAGGSLLTCSNAATTTASNLLQQSSTTPPSNGLNNSHLHTPTTTTTNQTTAASSGSSTSSSSSSSSSFLTLAEWKQLHKTSGFVISSEASTMPATDTALDSNSLDSVLQPQGTDYSFASCPVDHSIKAPNPLPSVMTNQTSLNSSQDNASDCLPDFCDSSLTFDKDEPLPETYLKVGNKKIRLSREDLDAMLRSSDTRPSTVETSVGTNPISLSPLVDANDHQKISGSNNPNSKLRLLLYEETSSLSASGQNRNVFPTTGDAESALGGGLATQLTDASGSMGQAVNSIPTAIVAPTTVTSVSLPVQCNNASGDAFLKPLAKNAVISGIGTTTASLTKTYVSAGVVDNVAGQNTQLQVPSACCETNIMYEDKCNVMSSTTPNFVPSSHTGNTNGVTSAQLVESKSGAGSGTNGGQFHLIAVSHAGQTLALPHPATSATSVTVTSSSSALTPALSVVSTHNSNNNGSLAPHQPSGHQFKATHVITHSGGSQLVLGPQTASATATGVEMVSANDVNGNAIVTGNGAGYVTNASQKVTPDMSGHFSVLGDAASCVHGAPIVCVPSAKTTLLTLNGAATATTPHNGAVSSGGGVASSGTVLAPAPHAHLAPSAGGGTALVVETAAAGGGGNGSTAAYGQQQPQLTPAAQPPPAACPPTPHVQAPQHQSTAAVVSGQGGATVQQFFRLSNGQIISASPAIHANGYVQHSALTPQLAHPSQTHATHHPQQAPQQQHHAQAFHSALLQPTTVQTTTQQHPSAPPGTTHPQPILIQYPTTASQHPQQQHHHTHLYHHHHQHQHQAATQHHLHGSVSQQHHHALNGTTANNSQVVASSVSSSAAAVVVATGSCSSGAHGVITTSTTSSVLTSPQSFQASAMDGTSAQQTQLITANGAAAPQLQLAHAANPGGGSNLVQVVLVPNPDGTRSFLMPTAAMNHGQSASAQQPYHSIVNHAPQIYLATPSLDGSQSHTLDAQSVKAAATPNATAQPNVTGKPGSTTILLNGRSGTPTGIAYSLQQPSAHHAPHPHAQVPQTAHQQQQRHLVPVELEPSGGGANAAAKKCIVASGGATTTHWIATPNGAAQMAVGAQFAHQHPGQASAAVNSIIYK